MAARPNLLFHPEVYEWLHHVLSYAIQDQGTEVYACRMAHGVLCNLLQPSTAPAGKLQVLSCILSGAISEGSKVVVVSTSTTALDLINDLLCIPRG